MDDILTASPARTLSPLRLALAAFAAINCAFGPLSTLLTFKHQIAVSFGVDQQAIALMYGAYFIVGGFVGRWLLLRGPVLPFPTATSLAALGLAVGALFCAWLASSFTVFFFGFAAVAGAGGGSWFLAPIASHVMQRVVTYPATGLAVATVGQLTSFGLWKLVFAVLGITDWHVAMTVAAAVVVTIVPVLAILMDMPAAPSIVASRVTHVVSRMGDRFLPPIGFGLIAFAGTVLILELGAPASGGSAAYRYEAFSCTAIFGRLITASCFDRGWRATTILCCCVLTMMAALGGTMSVTAPWLVVYDACLGIGYGGLLPIAVTYACHRRPLQRERAAANMFYASCVGIAAGAMTPLVTKWLSWSVGSNLVLGSSVAALIVWLAILAVQGHFVPSIISNNSGCSPLEIDHGHGSRRALEQASQNQGSSCPAPGQPNGNPWVG